MNNEFHSRMKNLSETLNKKGIDVALIMQNADLYYYSGSIPSGILAISKENRKVYAIRRGYLRALNEAALENDEMIEIKGLSALPEIFSSRDIEFGTVGIEMDVTPADMFLRLKKIFKNAAFVDVSFDIRWQRSIKSETEIANIKEASRMLDCTMEDAKELVRAGKKELEVSAELEYRARKRGHQGRSRMRGFNGEMFMGHIHSGPRSPYPSGYLKPTAGIGPHPSYPDGASFERIDKNEPVIVDFLGNYHGYMSDETRLFCDGKLDKEFEKAYYFCRDVMSFMEETAKPGVVALDIYQQCLDMAQKEGYQDNFMGIKGNQTPFVGHGIGLELDEFPFIAKAQNYALQQGMVFAFEPKVSFANRGSVGIENTYLVTENGVESLTRFPREIVYI